MPFGFRGSKTTRSGIHVDVDVLGRLDTLKTELHGRFAKFDVDSDLR